MLPTKFLSPWPPTPYIASCAVYQPIPLALTTLSYALHATLTRTKHLHVPVSTSSAFYHISNLPLKNSFLSMRLMLGWLNDTLQWQQLQALDTPVCATIPLRIRFFHDLQVSKRTLSSCLAPIYTLPLWMTLLLYPSLCVVVTPWNSFVLCAICCSSLFLGHATIVAAC